MRRITTLLFVIFLASLAHAGSKAEMEWRPRSDAAWREAKERGRPVLVEVWADWCPPCRKMDQEVWSDARVIAAAKKFIQVSVDASRHDVNKVEGLMFGTHGIRDVKALPAVILIDPWGEVLLYSEGFIHARELAPILQEIPEDYNAVRVERESLVVDRDNSRALMRVGALYEQSKGYGIANRYYREALTKPGAKENAEQRERLMFGIAANEIRRSDWKSARKELEKFRAAFPKSEAMNQVLLGLVLTDLRQKKVKDAEKHAEELRAAFPDSDAAGAAGRMLERARVRP